MEAFNHFAVEAAAMKVFGSEALDYVVDEGVQIHGGMGFSAEMFIDKGYRDSRINKIFEGTNEINRLLLVDSILKKSAKSASGDETCREGLRGGKSHEWCSGSGRRMV